MDLTGRMHISFLTLYSLYIPGVAQKSGFFRLPSVTDFYFPFVKTILVLQQANILLYVLFPELKPDLGLKPARLTYTRTRT